MICRPLAVDFIDNGKNNISTCRNLTNIVPEERKDWQLLNDYHRKDKPQKIIYSMLNGAQSICISLA